MIKIFTPLELHRIQNGIPSTVCFATGGVAVDVSIASGVQAGSDTVGGGVGSQTFDFSKAAKSPIQPTMIYVGLGILALFLLMGKR